MNQEIKDQGVIAVLLKRFEHDLYPRAKLLQSKVDNGGVLDNNDLSFLEKTLGDAHQVMAILSRHPEYASLAKEMLLMCEDIMSKSQQNSKET